MAEVNSNGNSESKAPESLTVRDMLVKVANNPSENSMRNAWGILGSLIAGGYMEVDLEMDRAASYLDSLLATIAAELDRQNI